MNDSLPIESFTGQYRWLSNFWPCLVTLDGVQYSTVERAYQAAKTLDPIARDAIRFTHTPGRAKLLGRQLVLREDWSSVRLGIMESLVREKFSDPLLGCYLRETAPRRLVEGNDWGDDFWGATRNPSGRLTGQNHLGEILTRVREELLT